MTAAFASAFPFALIYAVGFEKPMLGCPEPDELNATYWTAESLNETLTECDGDTIRPLPQTSGVVWTMRLLIGGLPVCCGLLSFFIKKQFPILPEMLPALREGIAKHAESPEAEVTDPVTGGAVTWLVEARLSEKDKALKGHLDNFPLNAIRRAAREKTFAGLRMRSLAFTAFTVAFLVASLVLTIVTVSDGWLTDKSRNLIPTMACVLTGVSITVMAISIPRTRTALHLHRALSGSADFPSELLTRYCGRFKGSSKESSTRARTQEL